MEGKGIKQQIEDNITGESFTGESINDDYLIVNKKQFDSFLDELTSNNEYPDDMEIYTVGKGWHKISDYR